MKPFFIRQVIAIASSCVLLSCSNSDLENITLVESGSLKVKVLDVNQSPLADVKVDLYSDEGLLYQRLITNDNGEVDFGQYNSGTYTLHIDTDSENGAFDFSQVVQIISGLDKITTIDLAEYTVNLEVNVYGEFSEELIDLSGYVVKIVPRSRISNLNNNTSINEALTKYGRSADITAGVASFGNIPVGHYIGVLVAGSSTTISDTDSPLQSFSVSLSQYTDKTTTLTANEVALNLVRKKYAITSVVDLYTSESINHNYDNITFSNNNFVLKLKDGGQLDGSYQIYRRSSPKSSIIYFYWNESSKWSDMQYESDGTTITLTGHEYTSFRDVVITLQ